MAFQRPKKSVYSMLFLMFTSMHRIFKDPVQVIGTATLGVLHRSMEPPPLRQG